VEQTGATVQQRKLKTRGTTASAPSHVTSIQNPVRDRKVQSVVSDLFLRIARTAKGSMR
jgi:hypothetical protein